MTGVSRPRSMTSVARSTARAAAIVDEVFATTAERNERRMARGRLIVCAAFLVRQVFFYGDRILTGHPRDLLPTILLAAGVLVSAWHLWRPAWRPTFLDQRLGSVLLDVTVWAIPLLVAAVWPDAKYRGLFTSPVLPVGALVGAAAGLRLERRYVVTGAIGVFVTYAIGLAIDVGQNAAIIDWTSERVVFFIIAFAAGSYLGDVVASRTRGVAIAAAHKAFEAEQTRERFGAYVGPEVAEVALSTRDVVLGGRRQPVAVLFCDLRGFTSSSEQQSPEAVVSQLNDWLEAMVAVIHRHGGVVDKYMGDGIMVVFGAPHPRPDDARRAVQCGLALLQGLEAHNGRRALDGLPPLRMGVGVHHGEVIAGNIGTESHAQYTVVGDVVNLASRLEGATREHGVDVIFSREIVDAAGDGLPLRALGTITVRGRARPVEVFTAA